ncbi:MAG TPA: adenylate/guanylate cyclase domain-containing protein [Allosphingosinicella sp.]|jgi:adenylate cyclase|nr:adenylate/guanylate cyclase domain-containing protein [Allosphingosinicella sp.]
MAEDGAQTRLRRALRQIGWVRLAGTAVFLLLALLLARYSWHVPLASDAERALYDIRFARAAERVLQNDRIVLITYDDQTLQALQKRSPLDRRVLAEALAALDAMKPRAIGIDILLDQPQAEDPQLLATLRGMKAPTLIGYADPAQNEDQIGYEQHRFLMDFLAQARTRRVRPASIKLEPDVEDGVIRRWPERKGSLPPELANAMTRDHPEFERHSGSIDFVLPADPDRPVFASFAIDTLPLLGDAIRDKIEGRYVLIGGNIKDQDDYETPMSRSSGRWMKGLEVHAHMLAQQLDGRLRPPLPPFALWLNALAMTIAGAVSSLLDWRGWRLAALLAVQFAIIAVSPFLLQSWGLDTYGVPAFGAALGWALAFTAVETAARAVGSEQRRFAQATLGKYLPADVAAEILKDPDRLTLTGEKRPIYALFSDLEGFTKLSHAISPEQLSSLLNRYLEMLSEVVLRHGGTIDKFVGDAIVAFWGAPIAREDDADRAALAAVALYEAGEAFRRSAGAGMPAIGCTRVGLHHGEAVVGNFGGEGRIQYTALGDAMNTASRLESANKQLHSTVLVSAEAKAGTGLDIFRPLGRVVLSGRATPVEVWEPVPRMAAADRARLNRLWEAFEAGDPGALEALAAIAAEREDAALSDFVYRLRQAGPGGHFVLGSK